MIVRFADGDAAAVTADVRLLQDDVLVARCRLTAQARAADVGAIAAPFRVEVDWSWGYARERSYRGALAVTGDLVIPLPGAGTPASFAFPRPGR